MKKFFCVAAAAAAGICSVFTFGGCKAGEAHVEYTLSADGTYYIVSGVSGDKLGLSQYDVPATYSAEEGGELLPVKEIGEMAFYRCTSLTKVSIPDTITVIGKNAFSYCGFSEFVIPESVKEIKYGAFGGCNSLTEVTIPASVTTLESRAFAYCTSLEKAYVKAEVSVLEDRMFYNSVGHGVSESYTNTALTHLYLPASLTKIYREAVYGNFITDIYFAGTEAQWEELYFFDMVTNSETGKREEKRYEKSEVIRAVTVHCNAEF